MTKVPDICRHGPDREATCARLLNTWQGHRPAVAPLVRELSQPGVIDDNYSADPRIPTGGNYRPGPL